MRHKAVALALLVAGMFLSYAWYLVPEAVAAQAWNVSQSALVIFCLGIIGLVFATPEVWAVAALLAIFKAAVIGCTVWYLVDPWPVLPGQATCSARLNMPLGFVGLALGVLLVARIAREKS